MNWLVGGSVLAVSNSIVSTLNAVTWPIKPDYVEAPSHDAASDRRPAVVGEPETIEGLTFVTAPGGCFNMGSLADGIVGEVCVDAFRLSETEVTNAQFRRFQPDHDSGAHAGRSLNDDDKPVVNVSWREAVAFADWLSETAGGRFRLLTEAEWEYACWAGRSELSDDEIMKLANLRSDGTTSNSDAGKTILPVGSFAANDFGLHDMQGNASEWVQDSYVESVDRFGKRRINPQVTDETSRLRVRRGGSWSSSAAQAHCAARDYYVVDLALPHTGFRVAQSIMPQER